MAFIGEKVKWIAFLVRSKIWVSLAAAGLTFETFLVLQGEYSVLHVIQVFFLTLAGYLFLDVGDSIWRRPMIYIAATGSILLLMLYPLMQLSTLLISGFIVLTYQTQWCRELGMRISFEWRRIPVLKNMVIALSWVLLTTVSVVQITNAAISDHLYLIAGNFMFIMALSIAEDILDSGRDDIPTMPKMFNMKVARIAAIMLLALSVACYWLVQFSGQMFPAMVAASLAGIMLLFSIRPSRDRLIFSLLIDGVIVVRILLVAILQ